MDKTILKAMCGKHGEFTAELLRGENGSLFRLEGYGSLSCFDCLEAANRSLIDRLFELETASRWIPVGERLPKDGVDLLVFPVLDNDFPVLVAYRGGGKWIELSTGCAIDGVTHWRELPAPPER